MDGKVKYIGIARDEYQKRPLTSIILADNVEEIPQKKFADNLYDEINHLRKNPKSFIKLYEDLIESIPNACVEQKAAAYNMINFLKSSRFIGPLQRSELLNKAAESWVEFLREEKNNIKRSSVEDSKMFLSDHCSGYHFVAEI